MLHLAAFYESIDPGAAFAKIAGVQDPVINVQGDDVRIPANMNKLAGAMAFIVSAVVATQARLTSPSIRRVCDHYISSMFQDDEAQAFSFNPLHPECLLELDPDESLNLEIYSNPAAASAHYGLVWLTDGDIQPVKGEIRTIRATSAITTAAGAWVNGNLTFSDSLASGEYDIIGMRYSAANAIAARLVFVGGTYRPGVIGIDSSDHPDNIQFRRGNAGSFGRFSTTNPPTVDVLGHTDTAQEYFFDVVKVS